jgi:hypothetical protein
MTSKGFVIIATVAPLKMPAQLLTNRCHVWSEVEANIMAKKK